MKTLKWGLGIGDWAQSPIPNPQSPIPNPQSPIPNPQSPIPILFINQSLKNIYSFLYMILLLIKWEYKKLFFVNVFYLIFNYQNLIFRNYKISVFSKNKLRRE